MSRNFYETTVVKTYRNIDTFQRICRVRFETIGSKRTQTEHKIYQYSRYALSRITPLSFTLQTINLHKTALARFPYPQSFPIHLPVFSTLPLPELPAGDNKKLYLFHLP